MTELRFSTVATLDMHYAPRPWSWADANAARIDEHWTGLVARNPALYDGPVLVLHSGGLDGDVFRGAYLQTRFSRFIAWRDFGFEDATMRNCFAMAALRASDGAYLLGVMGGHTANAGRVYFPAGTPDPDDLVGGSVDLAGNVLRELQEETGLRAQDVAVADGWTLIEAPARVACMKEVSIDGTAETVRARILATLANETQPELSDIRIVREPSDIDEAVMPPFVSAYLRDRLDR